MNVCQRALFSAPPSIRAADQVERKETRETLDTLQAPLPPSPDPHYETWEPLNSSDRDPKSPGPPTSSAVEPQRLTLRSWLRVNQLLQLLQQPLLFVYLGERRDTPSAGNQQATRRHPVISRPSAGHQERHPVSRQPAGHQERHPVSRQPAGHQERHPVSRQPAGHQERHPVSSRPSAGHQERHPVSRQPAGHQERHPVSRPPGETPCQQATRRDTLSAAGRQQATRRDTLSAAGRQQATRRDTLSSAGRQQATRRDTPSAGNQQATRRDTPSAGSQQATRRDTLSAGHQERHPVSRPPGETTCQQQAVSRPPGETPCQQATRRDTLSAGHQERQPVSRPPGETPYHQQAISRQPKGPQQATSRPPAGSQPPLLLGLTPNTLPRARSPSASPCRLPKGIPPTNTLTCGDLQDEPTRVPPPLVPCGPFDPRVEDSLKVNTVLGKPQTEPEADAGANAAAINHQIPFYGAVGA
ncbi:unnamed protein product [Boreogadus saida]